MTRTIRFELLTPEGLQIQDDVDIVIVRAAEGDVGVLHGHLPMLSPLGSGTITYRVRGELIALRITGGFLEVTPEQVIVLADAIEDE